MVRKELIMKKPTNLEFMLGEISERTKLIPQIILKLDSSQRFNLNVDTDGETIYMKCRAYIE